MKRGMSKFSKILALVLITAAFLFALTACSYDVQIFKDVDFATSAFKHITNGGKDGESPYNINAITGATLTVEGPGIKSSVPLSTKELENKDDGLVRGLYKDKAGKFVYEGMDVYYLLTKMNEGDSGIIMTDKAYKVVFKNANRETVAELTIDDIKKAHEDNQPVIIAYGMSDESQKTIAPFVFDGANEGEHTLGYVESLDNEDGCLKLVYNTTKYGKNKYKTFSNCAYLYVCEESEPGYKHNEESGKEYNSADLKNYVISISGKTLGYELDFTVEELENLVQYNKDGTIKEGGLGYKDSYSLANNTYWYVNEYEGLDLYKLLNYVGVPTAEKMGAAADKTYVTFHASDGYTSSEKFTISQLADSNNFGFYKKNSADLNDGTYKSTAADLSDTGYPVMLAYGVNNYPYTITDADAGYVSGLSNNGGPMRVIFGKTEYNHANGSNQVQYLSDIVVGNRYNFNTHAYTRNEDQSALAEDKIKIVVNNVDGSQLTSVEMTVAQIEDLIYGEDTTGNQAAKAKVKGVYEAKNGKAYESDIYEGINLEYLLSDIIGIPGSNGTATFSDGKNEIKIELSDLFKKGFNAEKGIEGQYSMLAFAKNGSPLVKDAKSKGYVESIKLNPFSETDPATYDVDNQGGPLEIIIPSTSAKDSNAQILKNVKTITVNVEPDQYAHIAAPYDKLASSEIKFYGEGLDAQKTYKVSDIEGMQKLAETYDFSILNAKGTLSQVRYRGISLYELMLGVGVKYNADKIILHAKDGSTQQFDLGTLREAEYVNYANKEYDGFLTPIIAFGTGDISKALKVGTPLTSETGGPLMFVMPQKDAKDANSKLCMKDIVGVEVTAKEMTSWGHESSDIYSEFLDFKFDLVIKNKTSEWSHTFTLKELEAMKDIIVRTDYSVLDLGTCEGIDLWKFVKKVAGSVPGIDNPVSVSGYASDGYSKDYLSIFYLDGLQKGILDAEGNRKPIIICYAFKGYPLVDTEDHEGYTGMVANAYGPVRFVTETNQGACIKNAQKVVVQIEGSGEIKCDYKG